MELGGAMFGAVAVLLALVLLAVYLGARMRTGKPPGHAEDHEHAGSDPAGDTDPVPREPGGGMPMVTPREDPADVSAEEMQDRARRNAS